MDECKLYELYEFFDLLPYSMSVSNNQMRNIVWATLKPYLKKNSITADELMSFKSDEESPYVEVEKEKPLEENEIVKLRNHILAQLKEG